MAVDDDVVLDRLRRNRLRGRHYRSEDQSR
jgi:hypothetical protein